MRRRLREGARQIAVDRYSVDRALEEYLALWLDLANESDGRADPRESVKRSQAPSGQ